MPNKFYFRLDQLPEGLYLIILTGEELIMDEWILADIESVNTVLKDYGLFAKKTDIK